MKICNHCHQHYLEVSCPHCESTSSSSPPVSLSLLLGVSVGITACIPNHAEYGAPDVPYEAMDYDEDGFYADEGDCDDTDSTTFPGAALEDSDTACMTDADGDGYGDANPANENVEPGTDCDDSDPDVNPGNENCE